MHVAPPDGQFSNNCKWCHLVAEFPTYTSSASWWPNGGENGVSAECLKLWPFFPCAYWWNAEILFQEILLIRFVRNTLFLEKKYPKKSEKVDLVDLSPDLDFIMMRKYTVETSLHTSIPPVQVNHNQYHCLHHQAEAYSEYKCSRPRTLPQCVWRKLAASLSPPRRQQLEFLLHLQKNVCN